MKPKSSPKPNPLLSAALAYAQHGFPVIPLCGKVPACPHGSADASINPETIRSWWSDTPSANIGLATGFRFWVLDVDTKSGGDDSLESLELTHGKLPNTLSQVTGTGGRHFLFQLPSDFTVRNSQGTIAPGIDTRGSGGYIVASPSVHPDTGRAYFWDGPDDWHQQPILHAPAWLLNLIREKQRTSTPSVIPTKIPKGKQHSTLVSIAGSMRRRGLEFPEIFAALSVINRDRCTEPGPIKNIEQIAYSICKYPAGQLPSDALRTVARETAPPPAAEPSAQTPAHGNPNWQDNLIRKPPTASQAKHGLPGPPVACLANAIIAATEAPEFAGALQYNELDQSIAVCRDLPWRSSRSPWTDYDDTMLADWLQHRGIMITPTVAAAAAHAAATEAPFHPIREYLNSLQWDGVPRINTWLSKYCFAKDTPYTRAAGEKWLIQAVARIFAPGCKADSCLILEGPQGIRKSTVFATLAGEWFTDELPAIGTKDASMQILGVWIVELAELDTLKRSETSSVKAFISRTTERFRLPYGRHVITAPRQCVFGGSVNHSEYLQDDTGNRRFWPISVGPQTLDTDALAHDRDQIWAEAVHAFRQGATWWLDDQTNQEAIIHQAERLESDPWDDEIAEFLRPRSYVTVADILHHLGKEPAHWTKADKNRIGSTLRRAGWIRRHRTIGGVYAHFFVHPLSEYASQDE